MTISRAEYAAPLAQFALSPRHQSGYWGVRRIGYPHDLERGRSNRWYR